MEPAAQMSNSSRAARPQPPDDKPLPSLPSLPSPTLTNPDMVLPDVGSLPELPSPERNNARPPSVSYLKDMKDTEDVNSGNAGAEGEQNGLRKKKSGLGLMSRKMMLMRSRTASNRGNVLSAAQQSPPRGEIPQEDQSGIASSPTIKEDNTSLDVGFANAKRESVASSMNSEDYAALPAFLSKYRTNEGTEDGETDVESPVQQRKRQDLDVSEDEDAKRRAQEEEEQNSAMLSRRAEEILANAKKRLNLMEGNLRGARDLVTPLTAANLKRATSLGSSHGSPGPSYATRRFQAEGQSNGSLGRPSRRLHAQASSPSMGREYRQGHMRGFSEAELPERPSTALERGNNLSGMGPRRIPVRPADRSGSWTRGLRGTRSSESLGLRESPREPLHTRGSPDPNLTSLPEDDGVNDTVTTPNGSTNPSAIGLGISRPPSTSDNLREQMSSLKGKISTLKERAREDNLRRQSMNNLRAVSPLNNAMYEPPEVWYNSASGNGDAELEANPGAENGTVDSPLAPRLDNPGPGFATLKTGSRNAFAEMQHGIHPQPSYEHSLDLQNKNPDLNRNSSEPAGTQSLHNRTPSGTTIVGPASNRYSHHQSSGSRSMPGSFEAIDNDIRSDVRSEASTAFDEDDRSQNYDIEQSPRQDADNASVYEDAPQDSSGVVAHEDRPDLFDYEHFFLQSAMSHYSQHQRSPSTSSASSVSTARGPVATPSKHDKEDGPDFFRFPPPTPETPETLREIERKLQHSRTMSADSVSTVASFATAAEGQGSNRNSLSDWPMTSSSTSALASQQPPPRPSTAVRRSPATPSPSSDGRPSSAPHQLRSPKSALRLNHQQNHLQQSGGGAPLLSPPMSPTMPFPVKDPTSVAVNALLDSNARVLGLKDKALLFGLVDDLRRVVGTLQRGGEGEADARRKLEGVKKMIAGQ